MFWAKQAPTLKKSHPTSDFFFLDPRNTQILQHEQRFHHLAATTQRRIRRHRLLAGVLARALGVAASRGLRRLPGRLLLQRLGVPLPPLLRREPVVAPLGHRPPRLRPLPVPLPLVAACSPALRSRTTATSSKTHTPIEHKGQRKQRFYEDLLLLLAKNSDRPRQNRSKN